MLTYCFIQKSVLTKYLQSKKSLIDFVEFSCYSFKKTNKLDALLRFIVIDMPKNEVRIYNSKAFIYQNDYDVWQFRIWLADEDKYFRQSLRTKDKAKAIADAEEMYEDIKYMKRRGKKIYLISIKQAVTMYIEDKAKYVGIDGANGIVEGRLGTIKSHMKQLDGCLAFNCLGHVDCTRRYENEFK